MTTQATTAALEAQLHEKEQLVAALTQRLEQTAARLDRIQRTGSDRPMKLGGPGLPPELVEGQQHLLGELQHAVQRWEEIQPGELLLRIEQQVGQIRDLIDERLTEAAFSAGRHSVDESGNDGDAAFSDDDGAEDEASGWEALKAGLLNNTHSAEPESNTEPVPEPVATAVSETVTASAERLLTDSMPEGPSPVDFRSATSEELQAAVEARDEYITFLIKKLRHSDARAGVSSPDWDALQNAPEELVTRLQELECRLEQTLRISEVELSVERARLGREETRLLQIRDQVSKQLGMLGLSLEDGLPSDDDIAAAASDDTTKGRRWLRFLGASRNE